MKLYYSPGACSLASHIALIEAGIDYEAIRVDLSNNRTETGEDFRAINPRGYVPAIESQEIGLLSENPAALIYIADRAGAAPDGVKRYRMLEWIAFTNTEIHGSYHPLFGGDGEERQAKAKQKLADRYKLADRLMDGSDWLVGDRATVADNYLFVTLLWADKFGVKLPKRLEDFRERNERRAAVQQALKADGLA